MGIVQIPQEPELANSNHHRVYIELSSHEFSQTVGLLKSSLLHLQTHQPLPPSLYPNFIVPAPAMPDLKQKCAIGNMPTSFQTISNEPTSYQNISNEPTSSLQRISSIPTPFQSFSHAPTSSFQSFSTVPLSHFPSISNVPSSHFPSISNVPTSSFQSTSIPKPIPLPIGTKKASFSSSPPSEVSTPRSSSPHFPAVQNLLPAIGSSGTTCGFSEIQGGVFGSDVSLADSQLEQLGVAGKISHKPVEEEEGSPRAEQESRDQGEDWADVDSLVRVPEELSAWRRRTTTPATKHNRNTITAMCYLPSFEEFNHYDDNSGWLISSSEKHLNLWQCMSRSSVSEPSLQVKSFQQTEFVMEDMIVDMDAKFLCALCPCPREKALCITIHILGGPAFFKYQGMIRIPCEDAFLCTKKSSYGAKILHLASLRPMGGAFSNSVAVACDRNICVYDLSSVSANASKIVPPKTMWQAHDSPISCMHLNSFDSSLITGASDGCIRLWDMKEKPCNPVRQYLQNKHITCIEILDRTTMCSSSLDGTIQLHDIRYGSSPFMSIIPDEKPILNMASLHMHNTVALTTTSGLFCLEFASSKSIVNDAASRHSSSGSTSSTRTYSSSLWPLTPPPSNGLSTGIKWNTRTCTEIYASQRDGTIAVFAK